MAYVSKEDKATLTPAIKAILKKYGMKGTISVKHYSTLVVKLKSGPIDFKKQLTDIGYNNHRKWYDTEAEMTEAFCSHDVNEHWIDRTFKGIGCEFLTELKAAMEGANFFNEDDSMTDYFNRSHYIDIMIGGDKFDYVITT
jgi:hypothetical protein